MAILLHTKWWVCAEFALIKKNLNEVLRYSLYNINLLILYTVCYTVLCPFHPLGLLPLLYYLPVLRRRLDINYFLHARVKSVFPDEPPILN